MYFITKKNDILTNMEKIYLIMNKPKDYVCSSVSDLSKVVYELLSSELCTQFQNQKRGNKLHTIGRLDKNTSGLLLFTNDGFFSHEITNPQNKIPKTYLVRLEKKVNKENQKNYIFQAQNGLILPAEKKFPEQKSQGAIIEFFNENECKITITQGKFHEVKRIFQALNNSVLSLHRISIGKLILPKDLQIGEYRNLTEQEKKLIFENSSFKLKSLFE